MENKLVANRNIFPTEIKNLRKKCATSVMHFKFLPSVGIFSNSTAISRAVLQFHKQLL